MRVPVDAIISQPKLTQYLLVFKPRNDKSQFLAQAGFNLDNWQALEAAIRELNLSAEAFPERTNEYGTFYNVNGKLKGVNGFNLSVVTVWLLRQQDNRFQFVTLKPGDR
ncbi:DUF6883 domain-containing protein [Pleurocapsa sp. PCC 7319]|uniref:DUF6883 domain-containing protein n=1 Tax=Pleurocapsa sp. PCC 7319 TaxID=118161 RepID=UPI00034C2A9F|nr:DUF6883 domain-containing protein [Pleurocapsa sp. PCC 7319]